MQNFIKENQESKKHTVKRKQMIKEMDERRPVCKRYIFLYYRCENKKQITNK